jgi:hypothetical protein
LAGEAAGGTVPVVADGPETGSPGIVVSGRVGSGVAGCGLAAGDATSYRYRSYCCIRLMSFAP